MTGRSPEEALNRALKFLSYRPRSEAELRAKLTQLGFSNDSVEPTVDRLRALHLLDDEAFARGFARSKIENSGYGPLRLERELRQKGVAAPLVRRICDEAFRGHGGKDQARALLEKRYRGGDLSDARTLRRAIAFLKRRGYRDAVIAEIVRQPIADDE